MSNSERYSEEISYLRVESSTTAGKNCLRRNKTGSSNNTASFCTIEAMTSDKSANRSRIAVFAATAPSTDEMPNANTAMTQRHQNNDGVRQWLKEAGQEGKVNRDMFDSE